MSIEFDLDCDLSFVEVSYELYALKKYLEVLEGQIQFLQSQKDIQFEQWLKRTAPDYDESQMAHQEHWDTIERIYPRYFRYPFIISLWAVFELALKEASEYIAVNKGVKIKLNEIRGQNVIEQAEKYFGSVLDFKLHTSDSDGESLRDLYLVRNLIAHANGIVEFSRKDSIKKLKQIVECSNDLSIDSGTLIIEEAYLQESYEFINESVSSLIARIRQQWKVKKSPNKKNPADNL